MQTKTARASGLVPFGSMVSATEGELRAFSALRFAGLAAGDAVGAAELLDEPLGSPMDPALAVAMMRVCEVVVMRDAEMQ